MTEQLEWFDAYPQPKALNRQPGYWLCILGCGPNTCRGKGDTPEEAIFDASMEQQKRPADRNRPVLPRALPEPLEDVVVAPAPVQRNFLDDYVCCVREDWRTRL